GGLSVPSTSPPSWRRSPGCMRRNPRRNVMPDEDSPAVPPGWEVLPAESLPRPTYFPAGLAMGVAFLLWGLITSWVILLVGVALFTAALAGWITEIRHEYKSH